MPAGLRRSAAGRQENTMARMPFVRIVKGKYAYFRS